jgi:glycerophosphoryl diester phosphodiesterase
MEIIAHRGASFEAPENTLTSFELGYQQNADGAELDIQLTRDGRVVVLHDPDTARTAGVSNRVVERTFEELRQLEIGQWGRWKGKGFSEKIPALEEVLQLVPEGKRLFMEIKCGPEVLAPLAKILETSRKKPEETVLLGFDYQIIKAAKTQMRRYPACWLVEVDPARKSYPLVPELIVKAKAANLDGLSLEKHFSIDRPFVDAIHEAGLRSLHLDSK